ncbi:25S rRNA (adenine(2142)-N(1))-methyltransferase [Penicillium macrosclerotiorum]|uniref:25S rRNA (adenine(2142)-N(1))-methyltransferase n=1 Tax=Penicillium macrosclerotiorum TaxID=303699 RepID=UPI002548302C|nr:25S rRNA (adenine(2142)-N(1))-methyltransferase [Penicillium macrosclerotiorum]KAJ5693350.1 25S rRNA (adenine(2142)-N(1))-methyltransferase [Penicillium macrosclerotiorum]
MAPKNRSKRPGLLSKGRPPTVKSKQAALSAKATRTLIRSHHQLLKARSHAEKAGDQARVSSIDAQIQANGGLESYQIASKLGQSMDRGGDSSKLLVEWIKPHLDQWKSTLPKLRVLEVGALSTKNACSRTPALNVTRIDLNSQEPGILKQDFMERPLPTSDDERFNLISLSLVLNYVPDAVGRGEMLKRCVKFLTSECSISFVPTLFFVLPVACIDNSRYLTEERLLEILASLGFHLVQTKRTSKLIYQLWHYTGACTLSRAFKKEMLNPGHKRNNFAVILEG